MSARGNQIVSCSTSAQRRRFYFIAMHLRQLLVYPTHAGFEAKLMARLAEPCPD